MSTIQFPKALCEQLDGVIRRFWWNPKSWEGQYLTPMAWSSLCWPQKKGGLGFRKAWDFNQALLSKLAWWTLSEKNCLCVRLLRAKYKVGSNWLNHQTTGSSSPTWRSIEGTKHLMAQSVCFQVGNGNSIRTWLDPWILDLPSFIPRPKEGSNPDSALIVSQLINPSHKGWDCNKLRNLFDEQIVKAI